MKFAGKLVVIVLLAVLLLIPLGTVGARGLLEGPIFGSSYTLKSGETLHEDLIVFGGSITIEKDAKVEGSIVLIGGSLTVDGEVTQDAVVIGGAVSLGPTAHIHGNLVPIGAPLARVDGARVDGDVVNNPPRPALPIPFIPNAPVTPVSPNVAFNFNPFWNMFNLFVQSVGIGLLAMLLVLFLPEQTRRLGQAMPAQPVLAVGMGLLSIVLFVASIILLALISILIITLVITVPLIIVLSIVLAAAAVFGWIGLGTEIGLRLTSMANREWPLPLAAGLGTFILNLVANGIGFIPCVGWVTPTLLGLLALGAAFITRFGTRPLILPPTPAVMEATPAVEKV